jgi:hypothetical protein
MSKSEALAELNRFMANMWRDIERDNRERIANAAAADPEKYKLSKILRSRDHNGGDGSRTTYWAGENKRFRRWFCVADHVNVAGYILTWRETWYRKPRGKAKLTMKRDQWSAKKNHAAAVRLAKERAARSLSQLSAK